MQLSQSNNNGIIPKMLVALTVIPVAALLIVTVVPVLLVGVTVFLGIMYFTKKKYENSTYYKYVNRKFSFTGNKTPARDKNANESIIDAEYITLKDENQK